MFLRTCAGMNMRQLESASICIWKILLAVLGVSAFAQGSKVPRQVLNASLYGVRHMPETAPSAACEPAHAPDGAAPGACSSFVHIAVQCEF